MSRIADKLKLAEEQRKRVLAGHGTGEAGAAPQTATAPTVPALTAAVPVEEIALKEAIERAQAETAARLAAERKAAAEAEAARRAQQRLQAEEKAASEAAKRRDLEQLGLAQAKLRLEAEMAARVAAERKAALDAEAARLETERRQVEALAAHEARERRRAQERPAPPAPSGKRLWLAAGALAIVGFFAAVGLQGTASKKEMSPPAVVDFQLKLDRDAEGFAARAGKRGRQ
jgi:hypothetical protein